MEDLNTIAADCVVICCCCQCLILQILVFALLRLPAKLAKKTREFAKRKLNRRRRRKRSGEIGAYIEEIVRIKEEEYCVRVGAERKSGFGDDEVEARNRSCENCVEEVEKVMMELYEKGEFVFGSFWGRGREREESSGCSVPSINVSAMNQIEDEEAGGDDHFVKYQKIQMVGSLAKT